MPSSPGFRQGDEYKHGAVCETIIFKMSEAPNWNHWEAEFAGIWAREELSDGVCC